MYIRTKDMNKKCFDLDDYGLVAFDTHSKIGISATIS